MIERWVEGALKQRFLVGVIVLFVVGYGVHSASKLPVEAFPDVTNVQVEVDTEARGLAAVEVEKLISYPIESAMNGLPHVTQVRSLSKTGISVVTIIFEDDVDVYFARALVSERLLVAREHVSAGAGEPRLGPVTTGLGQIFKYTVEGEGASLQELRAVNDWIVKPELRAVSGVADVLSFGGEVRQYQVQVHPQELLAYDVTLADLGERIRRSNRNAGGWYVERGAEQLVVRGDGLVRGGDAGLLDLANIVVKHRGTTPVYLRDVADVAYGAETRQGAVTKDGKGEVVSGIVLQLKGANTREVIERVREKALRIHLPKGVRIVPYYDQACLVTRAISTVTEALEESAVLILVVLFLFLWHMRSAIVVLCSIPVSVLVAFILMGREGLTANLQSLGGLAIGIGMMVDGSIVMLENIARHLAQDEGSPREALVLVAAREVARPVFFSVLIIVVVFLPLFTLQGVEGRLFSPMAYVISFALIGSLLVACFLVPALSLWLLRGRLRERESPIVRLLRSAYGPLLARAMRHRLLVLGGALIAFVAALATVPLLGTEFVPELEEGTINLRVTMHPSTSLAESIRLAALIEAKVVRHPEVAYAVSGIGRAELGGDPESVSNNEIYIGLRSDAVPRRRELEKSLDEELSEIPGIFLSFSQPIATRVDELLSGVKAEVAVKLFGDDLNILARKGEEMESLLRAIRGATGVQLERVTGEAQLVVHADRDEAARLGLDVGEVMDVVSSAIGGEELGEVIDGDRRTDISLRLAPEHRRNAQRIESLVIAAPSGAHVPLGRVARVAVEEGPPLVSREHARRRVVVQCNVRGRDLGGFVQEGKALLDRKLLPTLPPGYAIEWGGQFENQQRAQRTLAVVVPLAVILIFVLLVLSFGAVRSALLVMLNVPFSLIGGVFALAITGQYLSVPSSIGFIAVFGVAILNGVVLVSCALQLQRGGLSPVEAAARGAMMRLRPVCMTASVAMLGLLPLLLSRGVGAEVQRPLAIVVVGGLLTSTILTLVVLPLCYPWFAPRFDERCST